MLGDIRLWVGSSKSNLLSSRDPTRGRHFYLKAKVGIWPGLSCMRHIDGPGWDSRLAASPLVPGTPDIRAAALPPCQRVQRSAFGVQGLGFGVQGLGVRVWGFGLSGV